MHVLCGPGGGLRHGARARRRGLRRGIWRGEGAHVRVPVGLRQAELMTLITINVVRDTLPDCHFSAWSRPKPAPDPLPGPSVASGVIPTKGGRNGPVPATSGRASTGRWRSSPWKRCNHAPPRGRGQGAPRTARCIKTSLVRGSKPYQGSPSGSTPRFCITSSPPHGRTAVTGSKGSSRPGPSPLAATAHRGTFCAERDVLRTK